MCVYIYTHLIIFLYYKVFKIPLEKADVIFKISKGLQNFQKKKRSSKFRWRRPMCSLEQSLYSTVCIYICASLYSTVVYTHGHHITQRYVSTYVHHFTQRYVYTYVHHITQRLYTHMCIILLNGMYTHMYIILLNGMYLRSDNFTQRYIYAHTHIHPHIYMCR